MFCPFCNNDNSKVIDSRDSGDSIRRRRECLRCGLRFTTYERVQTRALLVARGTVEEKSLIEKNFGLALKVHVLRDPFQ